MPVDKFRRICYNKNRYWRHRRYTIITIPPACDGKAEGDRTMENLVIVRIFGGAEGTSAGEAGYDSAKQSADVLCNNTSTSSLNGFTCAYKASTDKSFFANLPK